MYKINFNKPANIHFIGIGGISMSGLAEILIKEGFHIQGSDSKESALTDHLSSLGCTIFYSQVGENITDDIDFVVYGCKDILHLEDELADIDTLRKIDIFEYESIKNKFLKEDIEKYGKQIY